MVAQRKRFRIESHPAHGGRASAEPRPVLLEGADADAARIRHNELMDAIASLQARLLRQAAAQPSAKSAAPVHMPETGDHAPSISDVRQLKAELDEMKAAITRTKKEIAALHAKGIQNTNVGHASDHLDAVVDGTEQATSAILGAAEEIDQMAAMLQVNLGDPQDKALAEDIQLQVVRIFEACNFQDLAGQRISKVVATLGFIEERIGRMTELWGGIEAFSGFEPDDMPVLSGERALLNGPALADEEDQASQDDIDAMFG